MGGEGRAKKYAEVLSVQRCERLLDQTDQLAHAFAVKDHARTRRLVQLRQRPRAAQGERLAILAHRLAGIREAVAPHLQRAKLGDAVLDVIERVLEEVRLEVPPGDSFAIQPVPVHPIAFEVASQLQPLLDPRVRVAPFCTREYPLLEGIDRGAVREEMDGSL